MDRQFFSVRAECDEKVWTGLLREERFCSADTTAGQRIKCLDSDSLALVGSVGAWSRPASAPDVLGSAC